VHWGLWVDPQSLFPRSIIAHSYSRLRLLRCEVLLHEKETLSFSVKDIYLLFVVAHSTVSNRSIRIASNMVRKVHNNMLIVSTKFLGRTKTIQRSDSVKYLVIRSNLFRSPFSLLSLLSLLLLLLRRLCLSVHHVFTLHLYSNVKMQVKFIVNNLNNQSSII
jgi:hypothetical protein